MIKTTVTFACIAVLLFACNNFSQNTAEPASKSERIPRNASITRSNSYSDLFTDSNTVEKFITQQKLEASVADQMRDFYNARNFQFAWFASDGLTEQALAFRNKYEYDQDTATEKKALDRRLDRYMLEDSMSYSASNASVAKTELLNTWRFIRYLSDEHTTAKNQLTQFVPAQKQKVMELAEAVLNNNNDQDYNQSYHQLKKQLQFYVGLQKKGGWPTVTIPSKKSKAGDSSIKVLKRRLQLIQMLPAHDTTAVITTELTEAVKKMQGVFGQTIDGKITNALIEKLNVPVSVRIQQILLNMERMRWMPAHPKGKLIVVNIPAFTLTFWDGNTKAFDMDIVVGKEGHSTVMFSGDLNQVVFSPYWNIPPSIVEKEVIPDMQENPNYLAENDMEITGEEDGLPVIRQLPGEKNALGRVKFLFPNSFNIYFHDTPEKSLFKKAKRAYSHGCIRLSDPVKMANYLLKDQPEWTAEKIDSAMHAEKEKYVKVKDPVPVLIYYFTSWVNEDGILQFRDDIYSHDKKLAKKMFFASE